MVSITTFSLVACLTLLIFVNAITISLLFTYIYFVCSLYTPGWIWLNKRTGANTLKYSYLHSQVSSLPILLHCLLNSLMQLVHLWLPFYYELYISKSFSKVCHRHRVQLLTIPTNAHTTLESQCFPFTFKYSHNFSTKINIIEKHLQSHTSELVKTRQKTQQHITVVTEISVHTNLLSNLVLSLQYPTV